MSSSDSLFVSEDSFPMISALAAGRNWSPSLDPKPQSLLNMFTKDQKIQSKQYLSVDFYNRFKNHNH